MWELYQGMMFPQMGNLAKRLARRLQELRGDIPLVQYSEKLGISKSSLARLEQGDQNVSLKTLETLCRKLKCDVWDLFPLDR